MSDSDFVQERAYIYEYTPEEIKKIKERIAVIQQEDECDGVIVIDILGE